MTAPKIPDILAVAAPPANEVYATFAGGIDQAAMQRILAGLSAASGNGVTHLHLLFQSFGGVVGDGVALYNILRVLPFDLTVYNVGSVQSIGSVIYLGAKRRKASAHATFMLHRTTGPHKSATASELKSMTESVALDDQRTEAILRDHLKLSDDEWKLLDRHDLNLSAQRAVEVGLAHEIGEFMPPTGTRLYNL